MTSYEGATLSCIGIRARLEGKEIVRGMDLSVGPGEVHAIMGPNGSGKSTMAAALMGHPDYEVEGSIKIDGEEIQGMSPDERSRKGLFLGFQYPVAIPGVTVLAFLKAACEAKEGGPYKGFNGKLKKAMGEMGIPWEFAGRYINEGFSGGEKKRLEVLQMVLLAPKVAVLDEIDSGLDIDALKQVSKGIEKVAAAGTSVVMVTHYKRVLDYVRPDRVHVFMEGRIVKTGGAEQAAELEVRGYEWLENETQRVSP